MSCENGQCLWTAAYKGHATTRTGISTTEAKLAWKLGNEAKSVIVGRDNTASPTDIFVGVFIIIMVLPDNSQKNRIASFHFDNLNLFYVHKC